MEKLKKRIFNFSEFLEHFNLNAQKPLILTHRGYGKYAEIPENTIPAFIESSKKGFLGHELDVRLSKDKEVVLFHGPQLSKTTNGRGTIENLNFEDIAKLNAGHYLNKGISATIPKLEEYIQKIGLTSFTDIEIKKEWFIRGHEIEDKVLDLILRYNLENKVIISSFNINSIRYIRKFHPQVKTATITTKEKKSLFWIPIGIYWAKPDIVVLHRGLLNKKWIKYVHSKGCGFATWGANRQSDFLRYVDLGIDIIITDNMNFSSIDSVFASEGLKDQP